MKTSDMANFITINGIVNDHKLIDCCNLKKIVNVESMGSHKTKSREGQDFGTNVFVVRCQDRCFILSFLIIFLMDNINMKKKTKLMPFLSFNKIIIRHIKEPKISIYQIFSFLK